MAGVDRLRIANGPTTIHLTASIGLAAFPDIRAQQPADLIALADQAMYAAKRLGKNRVCVATEHELKQPHVDLQASERSVL